MELAIEDLLQRPEEFASRYVKGFDKVLMDYLSLIERSKLPEALRSELLKGKTLFEIEQQFASQGMSDWDFRRLIAQGEDWLGDEAFTPEELSRAESVLMDKLSPVLRQLESEQTASRIDDIYPEESRPEVQETPTSAPISALPREAEDLLLRLYVDQIRSRDRRLPSPEVGEYLNSPELPNLIGRGY